MDVTTHNTDTNNAEFVDWLGVRIKPPMIVFQDIHDNSQYTTQLTVQNVGTSKKVIRFYSHCAEVMKCFS